MFDIEDENFMKPRNDLSYLSADELVKHLSKELVRLEDILEANGLVETTNATSTAQYAVKQSDLESDIRQLKGIRNWMEKKFSNGMAVELDKDGLITQLNKLSDLEKTFQSKGVKYNEDKSAKNTATNNPIEQIIAKLNASKDHYASKKNTASVNIITKTIAAIKQADPSKLSGFGITAVIGPMYDLKKFNSRHTIFGRGSNHLSTTIGEINKILLGNENRLRKIQGKVKPIEKEPAQESRPASPRVRA